jgi:hypothetical protein
MLLFTSYLKRNTPRTVEKQRLENIFVAIFHKILTQALIRIKLQWRVCNSQTAQNHHAPRHHVTEVAWVFLLLTLVALSRPILTLNVVL